MGVRGTGQVGRRGFLGRALVLGGTGALGAGALNAAVGTATASAAEPASPARDLVRLRLLGEGWHVLGAAESSPQPGAVPLTGGTLVGAAGQHAGNFRSARLGTATLLHMLDLPDGTVFGLGHGGLADADFAIIGGTGAYAGATGGYTAAQRPLEIGGDGAAAFDISFANGLPSGSVLHALAANTSARS